jgi:formate dehydrogenase gamma subunit
MEKNEKERGFWASIFPTIGDIVGTLIHDILFDDPNRPGVMRFSLPARTFHWVVAALVIVLGITGLILFVPGWGVAGLACWTRIIHRVCSYTFGVVLVLYFITYRKNSLAYFKEAFTWTRDDLGWLRAAIDYYTGGEESKMPPQGHINAGQKIWELITIVCGAIMFVTGTIMCFAKGAVNPSIFQWCLFTHALAFIIGGCMLIVHAILGAIHPRMSESLRSMLTGKISEEYAKSHYGKWYEEVSK